MELYAVEFANFVISNRNILFFIDETSSPGHIASSKNHAKSDGVTSFVLNLMVTVLEKNPQEIFDYISVIFTVKFSWFSKNERKDCVGDGIRNFCTTITYLE